MSEQRCKHGKAMENPCWECDEEKAERIMADVFNPNESDRAYFLRRKRQLASHPGNFGPLQSLGVPVKS